MAMLGFILSVLWPIPVAAILIWIFQWLWNTTMPAIFPVPSLTFWQALRLLLIAGALFGGGGTVVTTASNPF